MITYNSLVKKPCVFKTFTGLEIEEFNKLYKEIETKYPEHEAKRLYREDRKNAIGQGRKFNLELIDRLLMFLMYYKLYISYCLLGYLFNLNQSNVCRNIKYLEPLVKACIPLPEKVQKKIKKIGSMDKLLEYFPDMKAFIDATEQEIPRPKNKGRRKSYYSGKKKKHTVKTQIMVNKKGIILHKTKHVNGRRHDYDIFKRTPPPIPRGVEVDVDKAYEGIEKDFPHLRVKIPVKKKKGKELSKLERKYNKKLNRERVVIEHAIRRIKTFKIMRDEFRNKLERYDNIMSITSGLVNFRLMLREGFNIKEFTG